MPDDFGSALRAECPHLRSEPCGHACRVYRADALVGVIAIVVVWPDRYEVIRGGWPRPAPVPCPDITSAVAEVRLLAAAPS